MGRKHTHTHTHCNVRLFAIREQMIVLLATVLYGCLLSDGSRFFAHEESDRLLLSYIKGGYNNVDNEAIIMSRKNYKCTMS